MNGKKPMQKPAKTTTKSFTAEERSAMKERAKELELADGEGAVLAKIAEMGDADRALATRLHAIIQDAAPSLTPKLWYGMPAYAREGKVLCFFQSAQKFKTRYATFGFSDAAKLDDGALWPTAYALVELTADSEATLGALVKSAMS